MDGEGVFFNLGQSIGLDQVASNLVQLLFRGLVPSELLISLPPGLLEILLQLGCTPLGLGNRLRTSIRLQSIEFFLKLLDPVVHERDQSTRVMDSVEELHLEVLALHETITVRSLVKGKPTLQRHRSGAYQDHLLGGSGEQDLRGDRVELPRQLGMEKCPLELLHCRRVVPTFVELFSPFHLTFISFSGS
ncbi:hypothetical protein BHM03_00061403 [Ensete ventricosum]|nr:hypothetical protein BHM03_00061403 [Ensete ventricosum]